MPRLQVPALETVEVPPDLLRGFAPVWSPEAKVLVLGTFPGPRSLLEGRYYAHPRNAFWTIIGSLVGFDVRTTSHGARLERMTAAGLSLWDVVHRCRRKGSEDSRITDPIPNDFPSLLGQMRHLRCIAFNGQPAARLWRRLVLPGLTVEPPPCLVLPSTSPAAARLDLSGKITAWREALEPFLKSSASG